MMYWFYLSSLLDYIHHQDNQFQLVLIDYEMPQITGCELANKIAEITQESKWC